MFCWRLTALRAWLQYVAPEVLASSHGCSTWRARRVRGAGEVRQRSPWFPHDGARTWAGALERFRKPYRSPAERVGTQSPRNVGKARRSRCGPRLGELAGADCRKGLRSASAVSAVSIALASMELSAQKRRAPLSRRALGLPKFAVGPLQAWPCAKTIAYQDERVSLKNTRRAKILDLVAQHPERRRWLSHCNRVIN